MPCPFHPFHRGGAWVLTDVSVRDLGSQGMPADASFGMGEIRYLWLLWACGGGDLGESAHGRP